jgi:hypothetical protein
MGGLDDTAAARRHAEELLEAANTIPRERGGP